MKRKLQKAEGRRQRVQHRTCLYVVPVLLLLLPLQTLLADTNLNAVADEIPPFRPAKPELPPTFWEQNGLWVVLGLTALLAAAAVVWRLVANRPPPAPPTPAETARAALATLLTARDEPDCRGPQSAPLCPTHRAHQLRAMAPSPHELPDRVSAILRTYFVAVLHLSIPQLTNRELAAALLSHPVIGAELASQAGVLLESLDRHRFEQPNTALSDAVEQAVRLVELTEAVLNPPPATARDAGKTDA